ncbi:uroporphyrinogen-III C-methyltransferase [Verrucomicrobia bacterium LW23]|nr:uroporphyrinogen-III C-methyltransferase [Verrucomicrobia bacterium LW23]
MTSPDSSASAVPPTPRNATASAGKAYLVGAGPGDLGLVTLRARDLIARAQLVIYDYLCNPEMLRWAPPGAEILYAGKKAKAHTLTQDQINDALVQAVRAGKLVVRLKGGDPYVFGRGGEEAEALYAQGLAFEVVPGVTSAVAAPAYAGIPITHRDHASAVMFITGHEDPTKETSSLDWPLLARFAGTRVFLMGVERLPIITQRLIDEGAAPDTPAALVRWGTTPRQGSLAGTLATIAALREQHDFRPPAILVVGGVVACRAALGWFERRPLFGRRVVVTRTREQASALSDLLRERGADVLEIPTIRTVAATLSTAETAWLAGWKSGVEKPHWLVFTSPNGVEYFMRSFLACAGGDIRALQGIRIASVGPGTTKKLAAYYISVDRQPETFTAEALGCCFAPDEVRGKRICLARGNLANPELPAALLAAGAAEVRGLTVYETSPAPAAAADSDSPIPDARARFEAEGAHFIAFASSSAAESWAALNLAPQGDAPIPRAISIGPETSKALRKLGIEIAAEAQSSTVAGLSDAVCAAANISGCSQTS